MFPDLRAFIETLRRDAAIVTVDVPVDPYLEAAEIHRRVIAAGGPALLFTNVKGSPFRLVTNLFGSARRAELAFGTKPLQLIKRIVHFARQPSVRRRVVGGIGAPAYRKMMADIEARVASRALFR